jgi:hypothetical protein
MKRFEGWDFEVEFRPGFKVLVRLEDAIFGG